MAYTTLQYETLTAAIAQGALKVKYADKEVEYQSLDAMLRIKKLMEADLGLIKAPSISTRYAQFTKGL